MKNYTILEVSPNVEKLRKFREEYIRTFEGDIVNKIISRTNKWYTYKKGVYTPSVIGLSIKRLASMNDLLAGFDTQNKKDNKILKTYAEEINKYALYGALNSKQVKALKMKCDGDVYYFEPVNEYFYLIDEPQKRGTTYSATALKINEDLYNMAQIQYRNFLATTTPEDLSRYAEFFTVSDKDYASFSLSEEAISDLQRCGIISEKEVSDILNNIELSQRSILSLKK